MLDSTIDLYTWGTPNGKKPGILLAELEVSYTLHRVDIGKNENKAPDYLRINPNGKIPALVDRDGDLGEVVLFESGAILQYLAEKYRRFLPLTPGAPRASVLSWTYWQVGGPGPMFGQLGYFSRTEPRNEAAYSRYLEESKRLAGVLDTQLTSQEYICGEYSIADMMNWPWFQGMAARMPELLTDAPRVRDWIARLEERPAVKAGANFEQVKK